MSLLDSIAASPPADLLRLLAVPAFAWAAYRDVRTRRVPNWVWLPLAGLGVALLGFEAWQLWGDAAAYRRQRFMVRVAVSLGLVAPLGYLFWRLGGFGGADAKAVIVLAVLFPTYPTYYLPTTALPLHAATLGVFSLTVLSNTVVLGAAYPLWLAARNGVRGRIGLPMFVGRPVAVPDLTRTYGRLLETPEGFTRGGLDVDALRMYLRWRATSLAALRADPDAHRDPASVPPPDRRGDPGDGSVEQGPPEGLEGVGGVPDGGTVDDAAAAGEPPDDPWGAEAFLADLEGDAYGTTPEQLRAGLEVLVNRDVVWLSPGIPFVVPMFLGLVVALTFGDLLFVGLRSLGLA